MTIFSHIANKVTLVSQLSAKRISPSFNYNNIILVTKSFDVVRFLIFIDPYKFLIRTTRFT